MYLSKRIDAEGVSKRIDAEGVITLEVNTSDSTKFSPGNAASTSKCLEQKHGQHSFRTLFRRQQCKQMVPKLNLFGASAGTRTRRGGHVGRKQNLSKHNDASTAPSCAEVLIDRRQKARWPFFPPTARNANAAADSGFVFSKGDANKPNHPEPTHSGQRAVRKHVVTTLTQQRPCKVGDRVDFVGGEHKGKTGTIVQIIGDRVHVFVDFKNETWSMPQEHVQPRVFIPGHKVQEQVHCQIKKRTDATSASQFSSLRQNFAPNPRLQQNTSMDSTLLSDDEYCSFLEAHPSMIYNISSNDNLSKGKVVQVIEGPQRHRVGKILCVTAHVVHVLVDGSRQPCYFSPRMLRAIENFASC